jgi:hypothetical protein
MLFRVIAIAGQPPPDAAGPMRKQGLEPPDHFILCHTMAIFF